MVSPRAGTMQLHKLCKYALELEQSGGGWGQRQPEVGGEGEGRLYHDITPLLCCYIRGGVRWSEWRWRRCMGHWGAGGESPLQLLGCGHQCGGATYYQSVTTQQT